MVAFILKVLLVALAVAILYSWGLIKQQRKTEELLNKLYGKAEKRILEAFQKEDILTQQEMASLIEGTKASLFWSKHKLQVTDPSQVTQQVINNLLQRNLIEPVAQKGPKRYSLVQAK